MIACGGSVITTSEAMSSGPGDYLIEGQNAVTMAERNLPHMQLAVTRACRLPQLPRGHGNRILKDIGATKPQVAASLMTLLAEVGVRPV